MKANLPFANHPLVRATTVDESLLVLAKTYRAFSADLPRATRDLTWWSNAVSVGPMLLAAGWVSVDVRLQCEPGGESIILVRSRGGDACVRVGRDSFAVGRTSGAILSPSMAASYQMSSGFLPLTVALDRKALTADLQALTGVRPGEPLEFGCRFDFAAGHAAPILRLLDFIVQTVDNEPTILTSDIVMTNLRSSLMMSFLLGLPHNHQRLLERAPRAPSKGAVRLVEAYLDANADRPITISELADVGGVSVRALQVGFRAHHGCSPMAFLKERRLELAWRRLRAAGPGTTVTDVAHLSGFSHLGRFSREYGRRFGESPSDTLRSAVGDAKGALRRSRSR